MVAMAPAATADIEYTSALLTRVLSHLVGTLSHARGVPHITQLAKRLVQEWCQDVVPVAAVPTVSIALIEAAIEVASLAHPRSQADTAERHAFHMAQHLHHMQDL
jgi:hypothetical protein